MTLRVAINGFGRIGRGILRAVAENGREDIHVVAINDSASPEVNAHLLRFDSVHGRFPGKVEVKGDTIDVGAGPIQTVSQRDPSKLPWGGLGIDVVLECTGAFTSRDKASAHLGSGAKRVLVSAPADGADKTIVFGVNDNTLTRGDHVVSNASCTTNCLAPVVKVLHESFGIASGFMTTIHCYTTSQALLDVSRKDPYRGRAAAMSMIPASTGAARAIGLVLPALAGKLGGTSIRVPTPNVSVIDLKLVMERPVGADEINDALSQAANGALKGILAVTDQPNVSIDFNHDPHSSIVALDQTKVTGGSLARVLSWYDNEWGFSNRMLDTAAAIGQLI